MYLRLRYDDDLFILNKEVTDATLPGKASKIRYY